MITPLSEEKIKSIFGLEFLDATKITQFGGCELFIAFLRKIAFKERLVAEFGKAVTTALLQLILGTFVGADSMEAIAEVCKDPVLKRYVGTPVCATQIVRILRTLTASQIQKAHDFSLGLALLDIASDAHNASTLIFDIDATPVEKYGHQEGVEHGYVGPDQIERCYQYLFIRNDYLNTLLYGTIRGGSAHSQNGFCGYLSMILPMFGGRWPLCLRADSGFFNEQAFDLCCENSAWFFVKAPMVPARQAQAASPGLSWEQDPTDERTEYATYQTVTKAGWIWREVFKRTRLTPPEGDLFRSYRYDCLATNDLDKAASVAYDFYNKRARIENINYELKYDYHLGKIVTQSFVVNDVITQAIIMTYQLVAHFKRHCLDSADASMQLGSLRTQIFNVPARLISSGRRSWYRLQNLFRDKLAYGRILARLLRLRSVFVLPAHFDTG